ncbi:MAG: glycoside hydrolase family 3 N-terminal domain-containing protein [Pseudomonadota bacterium]
MDKKMTEIRTLAGQRLMLGFDSPVFNDEIKYIINDIKAGGIILFKNNIEDPEQISALCRDCQAYARKCGLLPLMIAVDQEGGTVARLKKGFTQFKGNPFIQSIEDARIFARITAQELKAVGINMNLAPVLDIEPKGVSSIMKDRVFKADANIVSILGKEVINTLQKNGIMAVAKHFPGIGRTVLDSHFHLPKLDISLETLECSDLIPFKHAIKSNVSGMMLSHIFYPDLDQDWQASLSPAIANELLRNKLGYQGIIMTDDLDMKAIGHDMKTCVRQILLSQIDMALICHAGPNIEIAADEINCLLSDEPLLYEMGKVSVERILRFKKQYLKHEFKL